MIDEKYGSLVFLLHAVNHMMLVAKEETLGREGISFPQMIVLGFLKENYGKDVNQKTIGEKMKLKGSSVTSLIGTMTKNGLLEKKCNPLDGREYFVTLTEKGVGLAERIKDMALSIDERATGVLSDEEKEIMVRLLRKMLAENENYDCGENKSEYDCFDGTNNKVAFLRDERGDDIK
ncbi:MAG: MarR family winged helix-turn-helix transcriptional regulator [Christensenellales bacterium]